MFKYTSMVYIMVVHMYSHSTRVAVLSGLVFVVIFEADGPGVGVATERVSTLM